MGEEEAEGLKPGPLVGLRRESMWAGLGAHLELGRFLFGSRQGEQAQREGSFRPGHLG